MKKTYIFFFLFLFCTFAAKAQYYDSGQDPSSVKWRQIKTQYFQIIFPDFYEKQAAYLAQNLDSVCSATKFSLPAKSKRIPLILHTQSSVSNGLVVWAPKRMEWWTSAPQQTFHLPWFEQLSIHEYRHVVQMENIEEGFSGILSDIFGQHITGAIVGFFVPNWFLEGDATASETSLSSFGRGRSADFQMELRALLDEKKLYSYDKAAFGSYKDFVPSKYILGYHLVSFGRVNYGHEIWANSLQTVARKPWLLNPFEQSIRKVTSLNMNNFYISSMKFYDSLWRIIPHATFLLQKREINSSPKIYTEYTTPKYRNDSTILSLKESLEKINCFVSISPNQKENVLFTAASTYNNDYDFCDEHLLWAETRRHPRWDQKVYTVLMEYDLENCKKKQITHKSRYFSPRYSPNRKRIIAIQDNELNERNLVLFDGESGKEIERSKMFSTMHISYPCFGKTDSISFFVGIQRTFRGIYAYDWGKEAETLILDLGNSNISFLKFVNGKLFFISDFQSVSQVYAFDMQSKELFLVTDIKFGIQNFDINSKQSKITYSTYSSNGYSVEESELVFKKQSFPENSIPYPVAEGLSKLEKKKVTFADFSTDTFFVVKKYHKWEHLFNFHSWAPIAIDPDAQTIGSGISVMSQNILSTSFLETGFVWNNEEDKPGFYLDYTYKGFFPVWTSNINFRGRRTRTDSYDITWNELATGTKLRFPWNFNSKSYLYGISPSVYYEFKKIYPIENYYSEVRNNHLVSAGLFLYHQEFRAPKSIFPRWGQNLSLNMNKSFNEGESSWLFSIYGNGFFPALLPTHSFNIYSGYQRNQQGSLVFSNQVSLPRGYTNMVSENLFSNKANYTFPIFYPDMAIWRLLYIKRIYANLFYDFMLYSQPDKGYTYNYSTGFELNFNVNILRLEFPTELGVRYSYMPSIKEYSFEFLFSFSI